MNSSVLGSREVQHLVSGSHEVQNQAVTLRAKSSSPHHGLPLAAAGSEEDSSRLASCIMVMN